MTHVASSIRLFFISTILIALSGSALAQYGASLEGTVTDKSGAVVPSATVTVTNQATGVSHSEITGPAGFYRITGLPPGSYKVDVEAAGFKKNSTPNVEVTSEAVNGANVILQTGSASETVTVTAATAEELQTETANVTGTITSQQIVELPDYGRDPYALVRMTHAKATAMPRRFRSRSARGARILKSFKPKIKSRPSPTDSAFPPTTSCWMASALTVWNGAALPSSLPIRNPSRRSRFRPAATRPRMAAIPAPRSRSFPKAAQTACMAAASSKSTTRD